MMLITYLKEAEEDFENIVFYYMENVSSEFGLEIAKIMTEQVIKLSLFPKSIRKNQTIPNARELVFHKLPYIAYVRLYEEKQEIEILRIIHTSRNYPRVSR
jgi:plasmid stabilization system protein ParE